MTSSEYKKIQHSIFENQQEYLSVKDLSEKFRVSNKTVRNWIYKGVLVPEKIGPRLVRFKKSYIEQWVSQWREETDGNK